ncbi:MAG TPA: universal stress protein [Methylomirabilota bacterium]|jgi:nucleotide-binding universal stress UspA family protein
MTKPILVGHDPHHADRAPVDFGVAIARLTGAPLVVASVQLGVPTVTVSGEPLHYAVGQPEEDLLADCSPAVAQIDAELRALGIPVECRTFRDTSAARALHHAADDAEAGLLVVGSSRRSAAGRVLAGESTAERLLHGAPCPVAIVPKSWTRGGRPVTIGVACVDTEEGHEALRGAHALARHVGARLRVLTVVRPNLAMRLDTEPPAADRPGRDFEDVVGEHRVRAETELRNVVAALDGVPVDTDAFVGDPAEVLISVSEHLDLLVLGSRAYGPLRAVLLGSVSRRVLRGAHCPVIVLPRGLRASPEAILAIAPHPTRGDPLKRVAHPSTHLLTSRESALPLSRK